MVRCVALLCSALLLIACGEQPDFQARSDRIFATFEAKNTPAPTRATEPTLTADEQAALGTIRERLVSMRLAAQKLILLGDAVRVDVEWKQSVRTFAHVITGGQQTIAQTDLPDRLLPLSTRLIETTEGCAAAAETILATDVDRLAAATVSAQQQAMQRWCIIELERIRLTVESL